MSEAWFMADEIGDQRDENRRTSGDNNAVSWEHLRELGVYCHRFKSPDTMLQPADGEKLSPLEQLMNEMKFTLKDDLIFSPEAIGEEYEAKLKNIFVEHIHEEEDEVRLVKTGEAYYDIRGFNDEWIRIRCGPGDLVSMPIGSYHRFTPSAVNQVHAIRLFRGEPKGTRKERPCDDNPARVAYVETVLARRIPKSTIMGPVNESDNIIVERKELLEDATKNAKSDVIVVFYCGTPYPVSGNSWCSDCVTTAPKIQSMVQAARDGGTTVTFIQANVDRTRWMFDRDTTYALKEIPSLTVLRRNADGVLATLANVHGAGITDAWLASLK